MNYSKSAKLTYDTWEERIIAKNADFDIDGLVSMYESYLRRYPQDFIAYAFYINNLISLMRIKEAKKELESIKTLASTDKRILTKKKYNDAFKERINYCIIRILVYEEKWRELFNFVTNIEEEFGQINVDQVRIYARKKLGLLENKTKEDKSYLYRQIIEYDYNDFIDHMKKHLADTADYTYYVTKTVFNSGYPLDLITNEVKKNISLDKGLFFGTIDDRYLFRQDGCGNVGGKMTDYFRVETFHNTSDIITMYPIPNPRGKVDYIDLNYINDKIYTDSKVKRKSQIDKFNDRYKGV